ANCSKSTTQTSPASMRSRAASTCAEPSSLPTPGGPLRRGSLLEVQTKTSVFPCFRGSRLSANRARENQRQPDDDRPEHDAERGVLIFFDLFAQRERQHLAHDPHREREHQHADPGKNEASEDRVEDGVELVHGALLAGLIARVPEEEAAITAR